MAPLKSLCLQLAVLCGLAQSYVADNPGPSLADTSSYFNITFSSRSLFNSTSYRNDGREDVTLRYTRRERRSAEVTTSSTSSSVPQFMKDLYERYATNSVLHPNYDIIRSFNPYSVDFSEKEKEGKKSWTFSFSFTSMKTERVKLAEFRVFVSCRKDGWQKSPVVALYELKTHRITGEIKHKKLLKTEKARPSAEGQWLKFNLTKSVRRAVRRKTRVLQLAIITASSWTDRKDGFNDFVIYIGTSDDSDPVLVVFSDEIYRRKQGSGKKTASEPGRLRSLPGLPTRPRRSHAVPITTSLNKTFTSSNSTLHMSTNYTDIYEDFSNEGDVRRVTRSTPSRRTRRRRRGCRRKAMYVMFEEINWHNQIIAPRGYQAYRCVGKCFFPLSDRLNPTKHAIIQTLLHTNYPEKASRPCCVPVVLDPIPILYIDEHGVVTYKYRFDDMVVSQCGCR